MTGNGEVPRIETVKASEAPVPPKKMSKSTAEILAAVNALKKTKFCDFNPTLVRACEG